jgi:PiT family inorganic phosphate transporter
MDLTLIVVLVIALALFFDFTNGFHDTANAMATPIATGALKPKVAVALAAVLNLVGAFLSTEVSKTISGGIIREGGGGVQITPEFIFAGLIGAIVWNLVTWFFGLPSSSSHALFGGLIGAALVGAGVGAIDFGVVASKVLLPALFAPLIAGLTAFTATRIAYAITRRHDGRPDGRGVYRYGQIFSSSLVALAHGTNDAQKTMGVITLTLIAAGMQEAGEGPQFWVVASCAVAIAIGTYSGGWRIILTMGTGLTSVKPAQGFAAETSTAATILASSHLGFALSTTQVASGSVIGSGLGRRGSSVRWATARRIVVGALAAFITQLGFVGIVIDAILGLAFIVAIFVLSRNDRVDSASLEKEVNAAGQMVKIKKVKPKKPPRSQTA